MMRIKQRLLRQLRSRWTLGIVSASLTLFFMSEQSVSAEETVAEERIQQKTVLEDMGEPEFITEDNNNEKKIKNQSSRQKQSESYTEQLDSSSKENNKEKSSEKLNFSDDKEEDFQEIWREEFDQEHLKQDTWAYDLGNIRGNEMQHYSSSKENVYLKDGKLHLRITDRPVEEQYKNNKKHGTNARQVKYNSGSITTHGKKEFLYGRIEIKAKLPKGKGAFPAFWTLGTDFHKDERINTAHGYGWPAVGEIDIMEMLGAPTEDRYKQGERSEGPLDNGKYSSTVHFYYKNSKDKWDKDGANTASSLAGYYSLPEEQTFNDNYHIFGMNWNPDQIEFYIDGKVFHRINYEELAQSGANNYDHKLRADSLKQQMNRPQYALLNLAAGGNWPGNAGDFLGVDETVFKIDWIRWLQTPKQKEAAKQYYEQEDPGIVGVESIVMNEGTSVNLLKGISTEKEDYIVEYSIDNEMMFINKGAKGGRSEVEMIVSSSQESDKITTLAPGIYNIHYSAIPDIDSELGRMVVPKYRVTRQSTELIVLPKGITGAINNPLSDITLPDGWEWVDPNQILTPNKEIAMRFVNHDDKIERENKREFYFTLNADQIIDRNH